MTIDQATGLGYLADKDNKAVVVFDTKTDKFVSRIERLRRPDQERQYLRAQRARRGQRRREMWVSDGDSTIKVVDLKTTRSRRPSRPAARRGPTAWPSIPNNRIVIVANSNDEPTFSA